MSQPQVTTNVTKSAHRLPRSIPAHDSAAIAQRTQECIWQCPTCGEVAPKIVTLDGFVVVHRASCLCEIAAKTREQAHTMQVARDKERMERYLGGIERTDRAWGQRLAVFQIERQREAYLTVLHWLEMLHAAVSQARQFVIESAQQANGTEDPFILQMRGHETIRLVLQQMANLLLVGSTGVGKSHLALAIYHACIDEDINVFYAPAITLLDHLRDSWDKEDETHTEEDLIRRCIKAEVLIIDGVDLNPRPWSHSRYLRIADERIVRGFPTIITGKAESTLTPALGEEALDRLLDGGCIIPLVGGSFRKTRTITPAQLRGRPLSGPMPPQIE